MTVLPPDAYRVTGEPDPADELEVKAHLLFGRTFDRDPFMAAIERLMVRYYPDCIFRHLMMGPADHQHLIREFGSRPASPFGPRAVPVFPQVDVAVDRSATQGVVRVGVCTRHVDDETNCAYADYLWLDTGTGKVHDLHKCTDGHCLGGTLYDSCGAEQCEGGCEYVGQCTCRCHD